MYVLATQKVVHGIRLFVWWEIVCFTLMQPQCATENRSRIEEGPSHTSYKHSRIISVLLRRYAGVICGGAQTNHCVHVSFYTSVKTLEVLDIENLTFSSDKEDFLLFGFVRNRKRRVYWIVPNIGNNYRKRMFLDTILKMIHAKMISFYVMGKETFTILNINLGKNLMF